MDNTKIQIYDDYCKNTSKEEVYAILDRLSVLLSGAYSRPACVNAAEENKKCA